jgi:hypothetical protein
MKIKNKGQIQSQIFVYILSIVIISLVLIYGYNAIKGFKERQEQITLVEFENDIRLLINQASPKYDSIEKGDIAMPSEFSSICFVDTESLGTDENCELQGTSATVVSDAISSSTANIFLIPDGSRNFKIGNLEVEGGCICIPKTGSNAVFRVQGLGNGVRISTW